MAITSKLVTYEEWLNMPEVSDAIEEVVDGEIVIMPPNKIVHTLVVHALRQILEDQLERKEFYVLDTNFGLVIRRDPLTSRTPDLAVFRKSNMVVQDGYVHSAPELVIEVLSPGNTRNERERKLRDYESLGVPEVWVLSPEGRTFEVLQLEGGQLRTVNVVREGQIQLQQFPSVTVDVASVWPA